MMDERPTLQVNVVLVRERQEVVALVTLDRLDRVALRVDKVDLDAERQLTGTILKARLGNAPSPGLRPLDVAVSRS